MKHLLQHEPLLIEEVVGTVWEAPQPLRDHFALVSIRRGCGAYLVQGQCLPYQVGTLILLGPTDCYHFAPEEPTCLGQLRFTDHYLTELTAAGRYAATWQHLRDYALLAALGPVGYFAPGAAEPQLNALLSVLFAEYGPERLPRRDPLASSLMGALLSFVGRQLSEQSPTACQLPPSHAASVVQRVLTYIRRHIAEPDCLRIEQLADAFSYSPSHLSALFRQATGESLRQYIVRYRLRLAEAQLALSTLTVSQIADELGFVDVCHLNKLFKKRHCLTPTDYRRQQTVLSAF